MGHGFALFWFALLVFLPSAVADAATPAPAPTREVLYFHADGTMTPDASAIAGATATPAGVFRSAPSPTAFVMKAGATVFLPSSLLLSSGALVQLLANGTLVGSGRAPTTLLHLGSSARTITLTHDDITLPAGTSLLVSVSGGNSLLARGGGSNAPRLEFSRVVVPAAAPTPPAAPATPTPPAPSIPSTPPPAPSVPSTPASGAASSPAGSAGASGSGTSAPFDGFAAGAAIGNTLGSAIGGVAKIASSAAALVFLAIAAFAGLGVARIGRA